MSCCSPQTPRLAWALAPALGLGSRGSYILLRVLVHPRGGHESELMPGGGHAQPLPIGQLPLTPLDPSPRPALQLHGDPGPAPLDDVAQGLSPAFSQLPPEMPANARMNTVTQQARQSAQSS